MNFFRVFILFFIAHELYANENCNTFFLKKEKEIMKIADHSKLNLLTKTEKIHAIAMEVMDKRGIRYRKTKVNGATAIHILPLATGHLFNRLAYKLNVINDSRLLICYPETDVTGGYYFENDIITSVLEIIRGKIDVVTRHEIHHYLFESLEIDHPLFSSSMTSKHNHLFGDASEASFYNDYFHFSEFITYGYELEFLSYQLMKMDSENIDKENLESLQTSFIFLDQFLEGALHQIQNFLNTSFIKKKLKVEKDDFNWSVSDGVNKLELVNTHNNLRQNLEHSIELLNLYKSQLAQIDRSSIEKKDFKKLYLQSKEFKRWIYSLVLNF